jgi:hypothetical protein
MRLVSAKGIGSVTIPTTRGEMDKLISEFSKYRTFVGSFVEQNGKKKQIYILHFLHADGDYALRLTATKGSGKGLRSEAIPITKEKADELISRYGLIEGGLRRLIVRLADYGF